MSKMALPAMCGAFGFFLSRDLIQGFNPQTRAVAVSGIAAAIAMLILERISKKFPKLVEYNLGIAMVVGMTAAVIYNHMGGK